MGAQISYSASHYPKFYHYFSGKDLAPITKIYLMGNKRKINYCKAHIISRNTGVLSKILNTQFKNK